VVVARHAHAGDGGLELLGEPEAPRRIEETATDQKVSEVESSWARDLLNSSVSSWSVF
jgi:hypothetical protein